jgi:hypothetical protein
VVTAGVVAGVLATVVAVLVAGFTTTELPTVTSPATLTMLVPVGLVTIACPVEASIAKTVDV